jgi:hypothetical protein
MIAQDRSSIQQILSCCYIFICLGVFLFVLGCGVGMWLDEAGLSGNRLAGATLAALLWPPYLLRGLGWLSDSAPSSPEVPASPMWLVFLLVQLLGWGVLGIPVGLWRAKQSPKFQIGDGMKAATVQKLRR